MVGVIFGVLYLGFAVLTGMNSAQAYLNALWWMQSWYLFWGILWIGISTALLLSTQPGTSDSASAILVSLFMGFFAFLHYSFCYVGAKLLYSAIPVTALNFAEVDIVKMILGSVMLFIGCCIILKMTKDD